MDQDLSPAIFYNLQNVFDQTRDFRETAKSGRYWAYRVDKHLDTLGVWLMPRKGQSAKGNWQQNEFQFVNFKLTSKEATDFSEWCSKLGDRALDECAKMTMEGYKPSARWDDQNVCFIASWTCVSPDSPNRNMCLTSRSADWFEALLLGVYKHRKCFDNGEWPREQRNDNWG